MTIYGNYEPYCLFCDSYERDKFRRVDQTSDNIDDRKTFRQYEKTNVQRDPKSIPTNLNINQSHSSIRVCEKSLSKCSVMHPCDRKPSNYDIRKPSRRKRDQSKTNYEADSQINSSCGCKKSWDYYSQCTARLEAGHSPSKCTIKSDYAVNTSQGSNIVPPLTTRSSYGHRLESSNCLFSKPHYNTTIPKKKPNFKYTSRGNSHGKASDKSSQSDKSCDENYVSKHSFSKAADRKSSPIKLFFGDSLTSSYDDRQMVYHDQHAYDIRSSCESKTLYEKNQQKYEESKPFYNESQLSTKEMKSYKDSKPSYESKQSYTVSKPSYNESKQSYNESKQSYNDSKPSYSTAESKIPSFISENKSYDKSRSSYESKESAFTENNQQSCPTESEDFCSETKNFLAETTLLPCIIENKIPYELNIISDSEQKVEKSNQLHKEIKQEFQKGNKLKHHNKRKQTSFGNVTQITCRHGKSCNCIVCDEKLCTHMELTTTPEEEIRRKIAEVCIQKKSCSLHPDNSCSVTSCPEAIRIIESCRSYHDGFAFSDIFQSNGSSGEKCIRYFLRFCALCALIKTFTWSWTAKETVADTM